MPTIQGDLIDRRAPNVYQFPSKRYLSSIHSLSFKSKFSIQLDPIYTAKMLYGIFDMINNDMFISNTTILAIHTGGLQGIIGMNHKLKYKEWQID